MKAFLHALWAFVICAALWTCDRNTPKICRALDLHDIPAPAKAVERWDKTP